MDSARFETACLAHVDERYYFGAYCRKCGHHARLSLAKLREHLGDNFPVRRIKDKLRCERCQTKHQIVVTFLAPEQRTASLAHFFARKPRD